MTGNTRAQQEQDDMMFEVNFPDGPRKIHAVGSRRDHCATLPRPLFHCPGYRIVEAVDGQFWAYRVEENN